MTQIRFKGFSTASDLGTVSVTVGADSGSVNISAFQAPATITTLPRISDGFDTDTLTVDTTGLTGITAYDWREVGEVTTLSATAALVGTGHGGKYVECEVTCDQGVIVSPPVMTYSSTMMGMAMDPAHIADDASIVFLVPHSEATHIAIENGNWTDPTTWMNGKVPRNGARTLIPHGITVTYDNHQRYRLDWTRVDGTLTWAITKSTVMLGEHLIGTRGSQILMGTAANPIPEPYTANIMVSGRDYRQNTLELNDLNLTRDPALWGRGIIAQGVWRIWGDEKLSWSDADPIEVNDTSATLHKVPTGWAVGKEIVIFGTKSTYSNLANEPMAVEDEIREISAINGTVVSWDTPLIYPHKNQLVGSTRTDLYPKIMLKNGHNVTIEGEIQDTSVPWRRGHTACAHHYTTVDHWFCNFIGLGRTDKSRPVGKKDENGDFLFNDGINTALATSEFTTQSNIAARYPVHMHHVGFNHMGARPVVNSCYVQGTPGWGMVHHQCDVDFESNAIYDFWGAGMVAESGNELGGWINNIAGYSQATESEGNLDFTAKLAEGKRGLAGDNFRLGYAFAYRGRAVRATGNVACSSPWGHVFYHREDTAVFPVVPLLREYIDIKAVGLINTRTSGIDSDLKFRHEDYPILHFLDNEAAGCLSGLHITKASPQQRHDVNIKLKQFKAWGCTNQGGDIEYIGVYILDGFDIVSEDLGFQLAGNTYQLAMVNSRLEATNIGYRRNSLSTDEDATLFDAVNDPRWLDVAIDVISATTPIQHFNDGAKAGDLVTWTRDDFDGTLIDYDLETTDTFPLVLGEWDGFGNTITGEVTNADGKKISNQGSNMNIAPKLWQDFVFCESGLKLNKYASNYDGGLAGHWDCDIGNGVEKVVLFQDIMSDPITGRPTRYLKCYTIATATPNGPYRGVFDYNATPTVQADKLATVAAGGTVVIDVVTGATGGNGSTYTLVDDMSIKPDNGVAVLDSGAGTVTYTPDRSKVSGTDEMYVFVESGGQSATVRIDILIGAGGAVSAPTVPTVTDHADANTIGVQLLAPPSTGGRRINLVQYSTDNGVTWRRLTHGWVQAVHKVTVESDGTAIAAGSYDVQIRYKTNYDYTYSGASAPEAVTVT